MQSILKQKDLKRDAKSLKRKEPVSRKLPAQHREPLEKSAMQNNSTIPAVASQTVSEKYLAFLRAKMCLAKRSGFDIDDSEINPILKPHQRDIVRWAIAGGCRGIFAKFGLGKTVMALEICRIILAHKGGRGLIIMPLGVRGEFIRDATMLGIKIKFIKTDAEIDGDGLYMTNYESVRERKINPTGFVVVSLDEADICRGFGGTKTFRELMGYFEGTSIYRFVLTATPDPNEFIELLAYAAFLGIMDVGQAKKLFFKRDSTKADKLTIHPHRVKEFWLWVSSWSVFLQRPSDIGYSDEGYDLPPITIKWYELPSDNTNVAPTRDGQGRFWPDPVLGLSEAAKEKRSSMDTPIAKLLELTEEYLGASKRSRKGKQIIVWCDLNDEQDAIEKAFADRGISCSSLRGSSGIDEREGLMDQWRNKETCVFLSKLSMYGSGPNLQQANWMCYTGIAFKFKDIIQGLHRIWRFLQANACEAHFLYTEAEVSVRKIIETKWDNYNTQIEILTGLIRENGLASINTEETMRRTIGCEREESSGEKFRLVKNDTIIECFSDTDFPESEKVYRERIADNSVDLIITSIPFSFQYEYSPSYNALGHTESNAHFWQQMDFLAPNLLRVLAPGRVMAIRSEE